VGEGGEGLGGKDEALLYLSPVADLHVVEGGEGLGIED